MTTALFVLTKLMVGRAIFSAASRLLCMDDNPARCRKTLEKLAQARTAAAKMDAKADQCGALCRGQSRALIRQVDRTIAVMRARAYPQDRSA